MINTVVRIVCLFISEGLIITVLNIVKKPQHYIIHKPQYHGESMGLHMEVSIETSMVYSTWDI